MSIRSEIELNHSHVLQVIDYINQLRNDKEIEQLLRRLESYGDMILIGGAVRDIAIKKTKPRDIDIIIDTFHDNIEQAFDGFIVKKNRFGGYKVFIKDLKFDIWTIHTNWAFANGYLEAKIDNISLSSFFNIDAIFVNLRTCDWNGFYFNEAMQKRELDILLQDKFAYKNPTPEINIVRAIVLQKRWNVRYSNRLKKYIYNWLNSTNDPINELRRAEFMHYGHLGRISDDDINLAIGDLF